MNIQNKRLIRRLPKHCRRKFINNWKEEERIKSEKWNDIVSFLKYSFSWHKTLQGDRYWRNIYNELLNKRGSTYRALKKI